MKPKDILDAVGDADDKQVKDAAPGRAGSRRAALISVCAAACVCICAGVFFAVNNRPGAVDPPVSSTADTPAAGSYALLRANYPERPDYDPDDHGFSSDTYYYAEGLRGKSGIDRYRDFCEETAGTFISSGDENCVYSPFNAYLAFSMLTEMTGGNTRDQLLELLGCENSDRLRYEAATLWDINYRDDGVHTVIPSNSVWLNEEMEYRDEALILLARDYRASSFVGKMGTEEYNELLRGWVNEQTRGFLDGMTGDLEMKEGTPLALASTLYFSERWYRSFDPEGNSIETFHAPGGDKQCEFMNDTIDGSLLCADNFEALTLDFANEGGKMLFILPNEGVSVDELFEDEEFHTFYNNDRYDSYKWEQLMEKSNYADVDFSLPKFDISCEMELTDYLEELGVTDVLSPEKADFSPLLDGSGDMYLGIAKHACRVKIDEEGCEAAAFTVMIPVTGTGPNDRAELVLDRPFVFVIKSETDVPLFIGVVNDPTA